MEPKGLCDPDTELLPEPNGSSSYPQSCFLHISFNIILHLCLGLSSGPCPSGFLTKILVCISHFSHECYMPDPSLTSWFDCNNTWWEYRSWSCAVCNYLQSLGISSTHRFKNPAQHTVLRLNLWYSMSGRNKVSPSYKTTDMITIVCIFIRFFCSRG